MTPSHETHDPLFQLDDLSAQKFVAHPWGVTQAIATCGVRMATAQRAFRRLPQDRLERITLSNGRHACGFTGTRSNMQELLRHIGRVERMPPVVVNGSWSSAIQHASVAE